MIIDIGINDKYTNCLFVYMKETLIYLFST